MPHISPRLQNALIGAVILVVTAVFSYQMFPSTSLSASLDSKSDKTYVSGRYGIYFLYPAEYHLRQEDFGGPAPLHHAIVLKAESGSIVIDMYENEPEYMSALDFVKNYPDLAVRFGNNSPDVVTRGSVAGIDFSWAPPYAGHSFVVARKGFVYAFSIEGNNDSATFSDYERILDSVSLSL
ncbi:MAG TPA: hypothetical protein VFT82_03970 [Candidatus Paceibacterota bacterium]|nr:hypothetical protein [Candidatus Paceibacterota bacterium]